MNHTALEQALAWGARGPSTVAEAAVVHRLASELPKAAARLAVVGRQGGRAPAWLNEFVRFGYLGAEPDRIRFVAPKLRQAAPRQYLQQDFFQKSLDPDVTAFSLLGQGLLDVAASNEDSDWYDVPLLRQFVRLSRQAFNLGIGALSLEGLQMENPTLVLAEDTAASAADLLQRTPPSRKVRFAGRLVSLNLNGELFAIAAEDGEVAKCVLVNGTVQEMGSRLGADIVVTGTASFRPSQRLLKIDVDRAPDARPGDRVFSRVPVGERAHGKSRRKNWLGPLIGTWPGSETEAELLAALKNGPH